MGSVQSRMPVLCVCVYIYIYIQNGGILVLLKINIIQNVILTSKENVSLNNAYMSAKNK